ncbi:MAG: hypothetical protein Q9170_005119 [Blastenia crenularia]
MFETLRFLLQVGNFFIAHEQQHEEAVQLTRKLEEKENELKAVKEKLAVVNASVENFQQGNKRLMQEMQQAGLRLRARIEDGSTQTATSRQ